MNKSELVDVLAERLGDRRTAATAVDGVLDTIVATVAAGTPVSITGFGVFEPRARAARVARNPRTGEAVDVAATTVPAFRPGAVFRSTVGGSGATPAPRATPARSRAVAPAAAEESAVEEPAVVEPAVEAAPTRRRATKGKAFAAEPEPEPAKKSRAKAGKDGAGKDGAGKDGAAKESAKESGKGKKAKAKK